MATRTHSHTTLVSDEQSEKESKTVRAKHPAVALAVLRLKEAAAELAAATAPTVVRQVARCRPARDANDLDRYRSDRNGKAALDAAHQVHERLAAFAAGRQGAKGKAGAPDVRFEHGCGHVGGQALPFAEVVNAACPVRVHLWNEGFDATPRMTWDRQPKQGHPDFCFADGAAVGEVLVDTLSGEWKLLRADIQHDAGRSLKAAIGIGQIEGAFIQGMGWMTMKERVWHPARGSAKAGLLTIHAPSTSKAPTANDGPADFRTRVFQPDNAYDSVHRSKAVGEPPLLLPFSAFFAIRDAISAVTGHRVDPPLQAAATSVAIVRASTAVRAAA